MKTITYEDFVSFKPCWLTDDEERDEHADQLAGYRAMRDEWSALDILRLDEVDAKDRLWLVLREELIDAPLLHEFSCRCAERALSRIDKPDERSIAAIEAKRKWLRGEISDKELHSAWSEARAATRNAAGEVVWDFSRIAAWDAAMAAARAAVRASVRAAARDAAWYAARAAARDAARNAEEYAAWAVLSAAAMAAEREWQIAELMRMLEEHG